MTAWAVFIIGGLITFGFRSAFILGQGRLHMPPAIQTSLKYVGPAAFAAIAIPLAFGESIIGSLTPPTPEVAGVVVGLAVMFRTRSMGACLGSAVAMWALLTYVI